VNRDAVPPAVDAGGRRFRLRASVEPIVGPDGTLYLARAGDPDLRIPDADPSDRTLLELLADGEQTLSGLATALALPEQAVVDKLSALSAAGAVTAVAQSPPLDPCDADRYARQLPWLAEFGDERDVQRRLAAAHVTVIGCGGLGTWAVAALLAAGVRCLRLLDPDVVELSNLNRQVLYGPAQLGRQKVEAAAEWLEAFDPRADVEACATAVDSPAAAVRAVAGADAVVLTADAPPYHLARWVNAACLSARVPFIVAGQLPPLLKVGPMYWPGRTACFTCHETALRQASAAYDAYVETSRAVSSRSATLGPASGTVGTILASEVLHLLAGAVPATAGTALLLDLRTLGMRRESVPRDPACRDCQHVD